MIPVMLFDKRSWARYGLPCALITALTSLSAVSTDLSQASPLGDPRAQTATPGASPPIPGGLPPIPGGLPPTPGASPSIDRAPAKASSTCLSSGDGYLRAHLAGAIEATIDWPNSGTQCEGEPRDKPPGVRLSFKRGSGGGANDLLFVFGITGVHEGKPAREAGVNLTVIVQGTDHIFGTLGDSRCTVDSLTQRPLGKEGSYRVEARGFCTQPAHAVRGDGAVLVSTFEFAGLVTYEAPKN
jgi:hypothetical protein